MTNEADLQEKFVSLPWIIRSMRAAKAKSNVIILDACRSEKTLAFSLSGGNGLAGIGETPLGFLIAYATQSGEKAQDGDAGQRNSPFMSVLLSELDIPGQDADDILKHVKFKVQDLTKRKQVPVYNPNLNYPLVFNTTVRK